LIEIHGPDVSGYYYTVAPPKNTRRRIPFDSTHGCVVTGNMCFSFHLLHGEKDLRKLDHALSVIRGIRRAPRPIPAPASAPTSAPAPGTP
jgi:hypothetical protein